MSEANQTGEPWFKVRFRDGREVELHSKNAGQIFADKFLSLLITDTSEPVVIQRIPEGTQIGAELGAGGLPTIRATSSNMANIRKLFETGWARKGVTAADIVKALEANAVATTLKIVTARLTELVKSNQIRRVKKDSQWVYFPNPAGST